MHNLMFHHIRLCIYVLFKVIKDLGLVVTLYDIKSLEGGFVFPGDGAPTYTVRFFTLPWDDLCIQSP